MSFNPNKFCTIAQTLQNSPPIYSNNDEELAVFCTIINRAYYAVYLRIRDILEIQFSDPPVSLQDHSRTRTSLIHKMSRGDLLHTYKTLYDARVEADYKINLHDLDYFKKLANDVIDDAKYILRELNMYQYRP
jgi:hypothetical protein